MNHAKLITPEFVDDLPLGKDAGPNANPVGLICAANDSRFVSGHFNQALTGYTVGWPDRDNLDQVRQRLFPEVPVSRRFSWRNAINAEAFLTETDDERPIGSPFKRVAYKGEENDSKTKNHGLTIRIDHDECDDLEAEVTRSVDRVLGRINRNSLRRGNALLLANDVNSGDVWGVTDNPDGDLRAMGRASADITGIFPNVYAIGELAWHYRLNSYEDSTRDNGGHRSNLTTQQLAQYLGADVVEIVKARYQSTATVKAAVIPARVFAYLAEQGAGKDDPSAVKRFVSMARAGGRFGVYRKEYEKFTDVSVEYYERYVLTGSGIESREITES